MSSSNRLIIVIGFLFPFVITAATMINATAFAQESHASDTANETTVMPLGASDVCGPAITKSSGTSVHLQNVMTQAQTVAKVTASGQSTSSASTAISPSETLPSTSTQVSNMQRDWTYVTYTTFSGLEQSEKIELIGMMAHDDMKTSGILASVTAAQAIIESGWMDSGLAQYNNLFGMKSVISGNAWTGSTWTGTSVNKETGEEYNGNAVTVNADFRAYGNCWQSMEDHSAYLANAMNGSNNRYAGIVGEKNPEKALEIIKNGGYATSSSYVSTIMNVIETYGLTRFDSYSE